MRLLEIHDTASAETKGKAKKKAKGKEEKLGEVFPEIEYPKEVELLDKLNEANKERYKRWRYKKALSEKVLGEHTLIIGVRGKDGIILGADTKAMRGGETDFEKKVRTIHTIEKAPVIFAGAGAVGVIEDFIEIFEKTLIANIKEGKISSLLSIKLIAEDLVEKSEQRYAPKLGEPSLHFVLGGLADLTKGEARLYEISPPGYGQKIKYATLVGHGSPYARTIAKYLFPRHSRQGMVPLECQEIVSRIAACIYWIRDDIDSYVGGEPQIVCVLDKKPEIKDAKFNKGKVSRKVAEMKRNLREITFE